MFNASCNLHASNVIFPKFHVTLCKTNTTSIIMLLQTRYNACRKVAASC